MIRFIYTLVKWPFVGAYRVKWRTPLMEADKPAWQPVSVKSRSGGIIRGLFARARTAQAKATIVLAHPLGKEAKGYFIKYGYTDMLRDRGYNTLIFDINGFGESSNGNFSYHEDILAIGNVARELTPNIPLGYHGISLGAHYGIIAFCDSFHPYTFAIIESAPASLEEFWIRYPIAYCILRVLSFALPRYASKIKPEWRIQDIRNLRSLLLIYSKTDEYTSPQVGEQLQEGSPVPTELWVAPQASHAAMTKSEYKAAYIQKIIDYFDRSVLAQTVAV